MLVSTQSLCLSFLLGPLFSIASAKRPNIVFILTDDQDQHMNSLDYMPLLQKHLVNKGTLYKSHYCTIAICCPSRVNLWTGKAAHNTNVTDVIPPYGGYPKFVQQGFNENYLPVWLQNVGYNTYYTGKLFNSHTVLNYNKPLAGGFNGSDFLLDPFTYQYFRPATSRNGETPIIHEGVYSTDLIAGKAYSFLDDAVNAGDEKPFFLAVAPVAPHGNVDIQTVTFGPAVPAPRHKHLFKDVKIPRTNNFNPDTPSGVSWVSRLPQLNKTEVDYNDEFQRSRLRALQAIDELVEGLVERLEKHGILDNTYIFYTTDNGYHISQHRLHPGKECGFEEDINVPLIVRGPDVGVKKILNAVTSHTDLAPTILKIAAGEDGLDHAFDGVPIPFVKVDVSKTEHVNIEYWGIAFPEGKYGLTQAEIDAQGGDIHNILGGYKNNTYKGLRLIGEGYSFYYSVWCTGEKELYDMMNDPGQLKNLLSPQYHSHTSQSHEPTLLNRPRSQIINRLDALLLVLKSCKGKSCTDPWSVLHPHGDVSILSHAAHGKFDEFYEEQPKVAFSGCELGYIIESEGPQAGNFFGDARHAGERRLKQRVLREGEKDEEDYEFYRNARWSEWT